MSSSARLSSPPAAPEPEPARHLRLVANGDGHDDPIAPVTRLRSRDPEPDAPEPRRDVVAKLAVYAFEAVHGSRGVSQLAHWVTGEVAETLYRRRALRVERRSFYHDLRRSTPRAGPVHLSRPRPRVADAVVVVQVGARASAVTMRLEHDRTRWRATELTVL